MTLVAFTPFADNITPGIPWVWGWVDSRTVLNNCGRQESFVPAVNISWTSPSSQTQIVVTRMTDVSSTSNNPDRLSDCSMKWFGDRMTVTVEVHGHGWSQSWPYFICLAKLGKIVISLIKIFVIWQDTALVKEAVACIQGSSSVLVSWLRICCGRTCRLTCKATIHSTQENCVESNDGHFHSTTEYY